MKHSTTLLATWVTLRILILLNWILGALIFALLAISFQAEEWTWRALGVGGAVAGHESVVAGMRGIMVIGIVGTPIAFVVFSRLLRIVKSVRTGEPFSMYNGGGCGPSLVRCSASSCSTSASSRLPPRSRPKEYRCASTRILISPVGSPSCC